MGRRMGPVTTEETIVLPPCSHQPSICPPTLPTRRWLTAVLLLVLAGTPRAQAATTIPQQNFVSAVDAAQALVHAIRTSDRHALRALFGAGGSKLFNSGDPVADARHRRQFSAAWEKGGKLALSADGRQASLLLGDDEWPFPIPLVRVNSRWHFDTIRGEHEILRRRIGRNELATLQVCREIVEAEREYAAHHFDQGIPVYAGRIISTPGQQDGLYWPASANSAPSPLGALLAAAADEHYSPQDVLQHAPYHGYFFRLLPAQGPSVASGARDYRVNGRFTRGFALLAWPARYGVSGIMTFEVNHDGKIWQRDLGPRTTGLVTAIRAYDPGSGWQPATGENDAPAATP